MPSYTIYANTDDYRVFTSGSTTWNDVRSGASGLTATATNSATGIIYAANTSGTYQAAEGFFHFDTTALVGTETSTQFIITATTPFGTDGGTELLEVREKTWSGSGTGSWVAGASLSSLADFDSTGVDCTSVGAKTLTKASPAVARSSTYGLIAYSHYMRTGTAPTQARSSTFYFADETGTANDPYLSITTVTTVTHTSTGTLTGAIGSVAGAAQRFRTYSATGALTGQGAQVAGAAHHLALHAASGALTGQSASLTGDATRYKVMDASGALTGAGSTIAAAATRYRQMAASGALIGSGAVIEADITKLRFLWFGGSLSGGKRRAGGGASDRTAGKDPSARNAKSDRRR